MVEDHVEDYLDAGPVQGLDHLLEFPDLVARCRINSISVLERKKGNRAVAPEVGEFFAGDRVDPDIFQFVEVGDRHQFDSGYSQFFEIGDLVHYSGKCAGVANPGAGIPGETPDMQFVDDRVLERDVQRPVPLPVEPVPAGQAVPGKAGDPTAAVLQRSAPVLAAGQCPGIGVEEQRFAVKGVPLALGIMRTMDPVGVVQLIPSVA